MLGLDRDGLGMGQGIHIWIHLEFLIIFTNPLPETKGNLTLGLSTSHESSPSPVVFLASYLGNGRGFKHGTGWAL